MSKIKRILLVDDDNVTNLFTKFVLDRYNKELEIDICLNGQEAINYLQTTDLLPDLIILDINMPLLNGFEFLDWQSQSSFQEICVVMYSTSDRDEDIQLSLQYKQVVEYIEKPFDLQQIEELFNKIEN
ncbi:response regulator [Fulvivirgaceae bacterium BMA10]|uniref:Response regulator n=1 Tax=Splendidivirga corallicola TaxID=3051826 RepID=A0ABT8KU58_9BACT|nr:response regulator [Fulvivirgaceae bacterium BMA10]